MENIAKSFFGALLGFTLLTFTVKAGSIDIGQNIYSKIIKVQCGDKTGAEFAKSSSQDEWEEALKTGTFGAKVKKICPGLEVYKEKWTPFLFEFCYEYASDTGKNPDF